MTQLLIRDFFENLANMKDTRRKYNPMVDLSKFKYNKKILSKIVAAKFCYFQNEV